MHAFWYTALFALVSLISINLLAFVVAYALTRGIKGSNLFRTVFFMPNLIGGIVLGYIWSHDLRRDPLPGSIRPSCSTAKYGFWGLVILMCWQQVGYMMIIYIAGLQSISGGYARGRAHRRRDQLADALEHHDPEHDALVHDLHVPDADELLQALRPEPRADGGPPVPAAPDGSVIKTTEMLALNIYNAFYAGSGVNRGVGQAKAVMFFILVAAIGLIQLQATRRKEVQQMSAV